MTLCPCTSSLFEGFLLSHWQGPFFLFFYISVPECTSLCLAEINWKKKGDRIIWSGTWHLGTLCEALCLTTVLVTLAIEKVMMDNFPNCLGMLHRKHIIIQAPSWSRYISYKKSFSIVLLALVDADYCFRYPPSGRLCKKDQIWREEWRTKHYSS